MSEILLQTIVEKLEALGIAISKKYNSGGDKAMEEALTKEIKTFQSK